MLDPADQSDHVPVRTSGIVRRCSTRKPNPMPSDS